MVKHTTSFKLTKAQISYLKSEANKRNVSQAKIITDSINLYKSENCLKLDLDPKKGRIFFQVYNSVIPVIFSMIAAYYFFNQSWLFFLFGLSAGLPLAFPLEYNQNHLRVVA